MIFIVSTLFRFVLKTHVKNAHFDCTWEVEDDSNLLRGIYEYGMGNWEAIMMDTQLKLNEKVRSYSLDLRQSFHGNFPDLVCTKS